MLMNPGLASFSSQVQYKPAGERVQGAEVEGEAIKGLTLTQVVEKLRGAVGSNVRVQIVRKDQPNPIELTLTPFRFAPGSDGIVRALSSAPSQDRRQRVSR